MPADRDATGAPGSHRGEEPGGRPQQGPRNGAHLRLQLINIRPSRLVTVAACIAHGGGITAVWLAPVPLHAAAVATGVLAVSLVWRVARDWLGIGDRIISLDLQGDGSVNYMTRRGHRGSGKVLPSSFVAPWLTVLNLRCADRRIARHVVLVHDNVDAESFRRLRIMLRWPRRQQPVRPASG